MAFTREIQNPSQELKKERRWQKNHFRLIFKRIQSDRTGIIQVNRWEGNVEQKNWESNACAYTRVCQEGNDKRIEIKNRSSLATMVRSLIIYFFIKKKEEKFAWKGQINRSWLLACTITISVKETRETRKKEKREKSYMFRSTLVAGWAESI